MRSLVEFAFGFAIGVSWGYLAAILLAPHEGATSRMLLQREAGALRRRPRQAVDQVQARVQYAVEEGRRAAAETRAELEATAGLAEEGTGRGTPADAPPALGGES